MKTALVGLKLSIGMRILMETLSQEYRRFGEVHVFSDRSLNPGPGVFFHPTRTDGSYWQILRQSLNLMEYRRITRLLLQTRADLYFFLTPHPLNGPLLRSLQSASQGGLLVSHIHDPLPHQGTRYGRIIRFSQKLQVRYSDYLTVFGRVLADQLVQNYAVAASRVLNIPLGGPWKADREQPIQEPWRWFALLGRLRGYKGIEVFLEAAESLAKDVPDLHFLIGGEGDISRYGEQMNRLGNRLVVENRLLENAEMASLMRQSWAVVLPYRDGSQSGVISVAYSNGCPVIVSSVGSLPELVSADTGLIVPPGQAGQLALAMRCIHNPERRERMGNAAFQFYQEHLIWEPILEKLHQVLFGTRVS